MKLKKILITGSKGFIGKNLSTFLQTKNYEIIKLSRNTKLNGKEIGDINKIEKWEVLLKNVDVVVHTAAYLHKSKINKSATSKLNYINNFLLTKKIATKSSEYGVNHFVFLSSVGVHGEDLEFENINENSSFLPYSEYTKCKLMAEKELMQICLKSSMNYTILRPPLIYGRDAPGNIKNLIFLINYNIPLPFKGFNKNKRSYLSIENLNYLLLSVIEDKNSYNEIFLVCDDEDLSTKKFIEMIAKKITKQVTFFYIPLIFLNILFFLYLYI